MFSIFYSRLFTVQSLLWIAAILVLPKAVTAETRLTFNLPEEPLRLGSDATLTCQVLEVPPNHAVTIFRPNSLPLTWNNTVLSIDERVSMEVSPDGIYALTIADVTMDDIGEYFCQIINSAKYTVLAKESVNVTIGSTYYFPEDDPVCESTSSNRVVEGTDITFSCKSDEGNPPVSMAWAGLQGTTFEAPTPVRIEGAVSSNVTFTASIANQNNVYICYITSFGFPTKRRSCYIGPLVIQPRSAQGYTESTKSPDVTVPDQTTSIVVPTTNATANITSTTTEGVETSSNSTLDPPVCKSSSPNQVEEGTNVTLTCTSDIGDPPVSMFWRGRIEGQDGSGFAIKAPTPVREGQTRTSNYTFTVSLDNQNHYYTCFISENIFLAIRTCVIGPFDVLPKSEQDISTNSPKVTNPDEYTGVSTTQAATTITPTVDHGAVSDSTAEMDTTTRADFPANGPECSSSLPTNLLNEGTTMTLTCTSEDDPPVYTTWVNGYGGERLNQTVTRKDGIVTSEVSFVLSLKYRYAFFVCLQHNTKLPDSQRQCTVRLLDIQLTTPRPTFSVSTATVRASTSPNYVFPQYPPSCSPPLLDPIPVGSLLTISCTTEDGVPPVTIQWAKSLKRLDAPPPRRFNGFVNSEITFTAVQEDHEAIFICYVSRPGFRDSLQTCSIGPIEIQQITTPQPPLKVSTTTLRASTSPNYVFPQYPPSCSPPLLDPITIGSLLTISCTTEDGVPPVTIQWAKSLKRLDAPPPRRFNGYVNSEITFTALQEDHEAIFICYVSSPGFRDSLKTCSIGPIEIQQISTSPQPVTLPQPVTDSNNFFFPDTSPFCESSSSNPISEGDIVTFSCTSEEGNPPVSIGWAKSGAIVEASPPSRGSNGFAVSEITLRATRDDDETLYVCFVTSDAFPEWFETCYIPRLQIQQSPLSIPTTTQSPIPQITSGNHFPHTAPLCESTLPNPIIEGYTYTLSCTTYEGRPPVIIDWAKSGSRVQAPPPRREDGFVTSEITLQATREDNNSVFICYVTSPAFPESFETCYIGPLEIQPNPYLPSSITTTQSPDGYFTMGMVTSFVGQANKTANAIELCKEFCYAFPDIE